MGEKEPAQSRAVITLQSRDALMDFARHAVVPLHIEGRLNRRVYPSGWRNVGGLDDLTHGFRGETSIRIVLLVTIAP